MAKFSYEVPDSLMHVYQEKYDELSEAGFNDITCNMYACIYCQTFLSPINEVAEAICETWGINILRSSGRRVLIREAKKHNVETMITALAAEL